MRNYLKIVVSEKGLSVLNDPSAVAKFLKTKVDSDSSYPLQMELLLEVVDIGKLVQDPDTLKQLGRAAYNAMIMRAVKKTGFTIDLTKELMKHVIVSAGIRMEDIYQISIQDLKKIAAVSGDFQGMRGREAYDSAKLLLLGDLKKDYVTQDAANVCAQKQAVELLRIAAADGCNIAYGLLAICYFNGIGMKKDYEEAYRCIMMPEALSEDFLDQKRNMVGKLYAMRQDLRKKKILCTLLFMSIPFVMYVMYMMYMSWGGGVLRVFLIVVLAVNFIVCIYRLIIKKERSLFFNKSSELSVKIEAHQKKILKPNEMKKMKAHFEVLAAVIIIFLTGGIVFIGNTGDDKNNDGIITMIQTNEAVMNSVRKNEFVDERSSKKGTTENKPKESSGAVAAATLSREEYEAAFTVQLGENQFGLKDNHIYNMTNGIRLASNGNYSCLKTDGTCLYCIKDGSELRRYDDPGIGSLDTGTMKKIGIAEKAAAYEVTENGIVYLLTSDGKVYRIDLEAGTEPEEVLEHVTSLAYDGGNLYAVQEKSVYCYAADQAAPGKETGTWELPESPNELYVASGTTGYLVSGTFCIYDQQNKSAEACVALDMNQSYSMADGCLYGVMKKAGSEDEYREGRFDLKKRTIGWIAE